MRQGLEQWLAFLSEKHLPILLRTKKDVQALIDQAQLSITQYSTSIVYDAGFSTHIFHYVNSQRTATGKHALTTMSNALSHLGQSSFQALLNEIKVLEDLKLAERNYQGYMRVMGQACHAALQATEWAQQRNVTNTEETQLSALLQNVIELLLWCYGDDVMPKIEELCYVKKQSYEKATKTILGCGILELGAKLAELWSLPEMVIDGLTSRQDDFTLATGVSFASELSRIVALNWYGKDAINIINRIAKYKGSAEGEIERQLHIIAVNVNDVMLDKGFYSPAKTLFQLPDDKYIYPEFIFLEESTSILEANEKPESKRVKTKAPVAREVMLNKIKARQLAAKKIAKDNNEPPVKVDNKESNKEKAGQKKSSISKELAISIQEFKKMVSEGVAVHKLIEHTVKSCLLCGIQRSVFFIKEPKKRLLVLRYSESITELDPIKEMNILMDKPHVFTLLMDKSRNVFLNESNIGRYWKAIPDMVKLKIGVKQFFCMSIFTNDNAMGLMYADKVKGDLTQDEFNQFQAICRLLSKGIIQAAHNKKVKSAD